MRGITKRTLRAENTKLKMERELIRRYLTKHMELADLSEDDYICFMGVVLDGEKMENEMTNVFHTPKKSKFYLPKGGVDFLAILLAAAQANKEVKP